MSEKKKRRPSTWYMLVQWLVGDKKGWLSIYNKSYIKRWYVEGEDYEVLCDDQPIKVLQKMHKLANEET